LGNSPALGAFAFGSADDRDNEKEHKVTTAAKPNTVKRKDRMEAS
jgi:hypothetical protein